MCDSSASSDMGDSSDSSSMCDVCSMCDSSDSSSMCDSIESILSHMELLSHMNYCHCESVTVVPCVTVARAKLKCRAWGQG